MSLWVLFFIGFFVTLAWLGLSKKNTGKDNHLATEKATNKTNNKSKEWKERRSRLYAKQEKQVRQKRIWAVLRYLVTYKKLHESRNFYEYKRNLDDFDNTVNIMTDVQPDEYSFNAAYRFCKIEHQKGLCDYDLSREDLIFATKWNTNTIDKQDILNKVLVSYQTYWDGVLKSYVRSSAAKSRITYLIEDLDRIIASPDFQNYPVFLQKAKELQTHYQCLLSENNKG